MSPRCARCSKGHRKCQRPCHKCASTSHCETCHNSPEDCALPARPNGVEKGLSEKRPSAGGKNVTVTPYTFGSSDEYEADSSDEGAESSGAESSGAESSGAESSDDDSSDDDSSDDDSSDDDSSYDDESSGEGKEADKKIVAEEEEEEEDAEPPASSPSPIFTVVATTPPPVAISPAQPPVPVLAPAAVSAVIAVETSPSSVAAAATIVEPPQTRPMFSIKKIAFKNNRWRYTIVGTRDGVTEKKVKTSEYLNMPGKETLQGLARTTHLRASGLVSSGLKVPDWEKKHKRKRLELNECEESRKKARAEADRLAEKLTAADDEIVRIRAATELREKEFADQFEQLERLHALNAQTTSSTAVAEAERSAKEKITSLERELISARKAHEEGDTLVADTNAQLASWNAQRLAHMRNIGTKVGEIMSDLCSVEGLVGGEVQTLGSFDMLFSSPPQLDTMPLAPGLDFSGAPLTDIEAEAETFAAAAAADGDHFCPDKGGADPELPSVGLNLGTSESPSAFLGLVEGE